MRKVACCLAFKVFHCRLWNLQEDTVVNPVAGKHLLRSSIPTKKSTSTSAPQCNRVSVSADIHLLALMLSKMQTGDTYMALSVVRLNDLLLELHGSSTPIAADPLAPLLVAALQLLGNKMPLACLYWGAWCPACKYL